MPPTDTRNHPIPGPTGPEPSIDTTKRQMPGPATQGPLKTDPAKDPEAPKLPHERDESVDMTHGEPQASTPINAIKLIADSAYAESARGHFDH